MLWLLLAVGALAAPCAVPNGLGERAGGRCAVVACYAGYAPAGDFCAPCALGTYKDSDGNATCVPCANAPARAVYTRMGAADAWCAYECQAGYYGTRCLSLYLLSVLGGTTVGAVLLVLYVHAERRRRALRREMIKRR